MSIINLHNIDVERGSTQVLKNVSVDIEAGSFVGIIGRSGEGKTTLLNLLAGFIPFQSGEMQVNGKVNFVFQNHALFDFMTVAENIGFGIKHKNLSEKRSKIKFFLEKINLADYGNRYPSQLSGGQAQRVALARALAAEPDILLLDEPFSALDMFTRDHIIEFVAGFLEEMSHQKTITTVMVSHYLDEILFLSDTILVIAEGTVHASLPVSLARPRRNDMRFSTAFNEQKRQLSSLLNS